MKNQPSMDDQFLEKVCRIIDENLDNESFSVENLAQQAGISRSMLHRKLIKLTGKSASDLITQNRLSKAKELLENNVATASEIAYRVGFNSPSYFNKVFKKHFNVSPGDVKKGAVISYDRLLQGQEKETQDSGKPGSKNLYRRILIILIIVIAIGTGIYLVFTLTGTSEKSIAVLPLQNLTGNANNDYFVDGMQDELIGELGRIGSIRVISRTSTLRYRNTKMLLKDIANELGVNNIVEGSVFCAGDSICFSFQLIDVFPKERHIMANEYYDDMSDVLTVETAAVKSVAQKINAKLTKVEKQRLVKSRKVNPETYKAYLRGMYYINQGTSGGFETGIKYMQEAIDDDPGDPYAYAYLALGYALMGHGVLTPEEAFLRATSAAQKAIKLDSTIDEAHTALALLYLYDSWDWSASKEAFENALVNNPSNEIAHAHFAWYYVLIKDWDKAVYHAKMAVMLEPFSAEYSSWLAFIYKYKKDYVQAEYWAKKALALNSDNDYGNIVMANISLDKKQYTKALEYIEKLPEKSDYLKIYRARIYIKTGHRDKVLKYWNDMTEASKVHQTNPCYMGVLAAYLGFTDKAFELLNDAVAHKIYPVNYSIVSGISENIQNDPRYNLLVQKLNLPSDHALITSK